MTGKRFDMSKILPADFRRSRLALCLSLALLTPMTGCKHDVNHEGRVPIVQVNNRFLYQEDLKKALPLNLSKDDSTRLANDYIRGWVEEALLYEKAEKNVKSSERIEQLVREYRQMLIMQEYQQQLIAQKLGDELTDEEIQQFYNANRDLFILKEPAIKGLFVKVPRSAPGLSDLKKWYRNNDDASLEKIEKYCFRNAVIYEYFYDHWVPLSDLDGKLKTNLNDLEHNLQEHKNFETEDDEFCYLLHVEDFVLQGKVKPLELARKEITDMLVNYRQVSFMQQVKKDLYDRSVETGRVTFFDKNE